MRQGSDSSKIKLTLRGTGSELLGSIIDLYPSTTPYVVQVSRRNIRWLVFVPLLVPRPHDTNRDRHHRAHVDGEPENEICARDVFRIEEHESYVVAIGVETADGASLDINGAHIHPPLHDGPLNCRQRLEGIRGSIIESTVICRDSQIAEPIVNPADKVAQRRSYCCAASAGGQ